MVFIEVPHFVKTRPWGYVAIGVATSLLIAASAFTFSFFLRDLLFELLRRWGHYDVNHPENYSTEKMTIVHLIIILFITSYVVISFLILRWIFIESDIDKEINKAPSKLKAPSKTK